MRLVLLGILGLGSTLASSASAQCRLSSWGNGFGALDRGRAILSTANAAGTSVQFFAKSPDGWVAEGFFATGDLQLLYDLPVAIDGDRAIAGSPESAIQRGRAIIFDRSGTQWIPTELTAPSIGPGDFFGSAVALDGDVAVVGADHWPVGGGDNIPLIHVFEHPGATWDEVAQFQIDAKAIDVEGTTFVVGDGHTPPGPVSIYDRIGSTWTLTMHLTAVIPSGPRFGSSVALQGDTLAVGAATYNGSAGYVEIFRRGAGGVWTFVQHIVPVGSAPADEFGESIALSASTLLVGAPGHAQRRGRVYRFEHDGTAYVEASSFSPGVVNAAFGRALSFQREDAVIHADWNDNAFFRLGFAEADAFCPATPNSTGARGVLAVEGCDSRSGERLSLVADRLPPGVLGFVAFGLNTVQQPFGDGTLCIGASSHRLPVAMTDASGTLVHDVDFGAVPGSLIASGRTWKFQTLFRDPASSGTGLNLTNALAIGITP